MGGPCEADRPLSVGQPSSLRGVVPRVSYAVADIQCQSIRLATDRGAPLVQSNRRKKRKTTVRKVGSAAGEKQLFPKDSDRSHSFKLMYAFDILNQVSFHELYIVHLLCVLRVRWFRVVLRSGLSDPWQVLGV